MRLFHVSGLAWLGMVLLLTGCGAAVRKSGVPTNGPLTPAAIYIQPCNDAVSGGKDALLGILLCHALPVTLGQELARSGLKYEVISTGQWHGGDDTVIPDERKEQALGTRYRIIVKNIHSARVSTGGGTYPGQTMVIVTSSVVATVDLRVEDAQTNELKGVAQIYMPAAPDDITQFAKRIVQGIAGPRCQSINQWSIGGAFRSSFGPTCNSFSLDDDSNLSKNPLRNMFGVGKSDDEK